MNSSESTRVSTRPGQLIAAAMVARDGDYAVRVVVPRASLPHVFDAFYRVADGTPRPAGFGLGLAVAKGLVEAHGGRIWAENQPGNGARFAFTLPVTEKNLALVP